MYYDVDGYRKENTIDLTVHNAFVRIVRSGCTALTISTLPEALAACDGPYRIQAMNSENGVVTWVHVSDERCTMLHDHAGNSLLAIDDPFEVGKASSFGGAAVGVGDPLYKEWWTEITRNASTLPYLGVDAGVVCTAASQTTRLVFDLTKTGQTTTPCNDANNAGTNAKATVCTSARFKLSSQQDGSIISDSSSSVHLRINYAAGLMQNDAMSTGVANLGLTEAAPDDGASALLIKVVVDGVQATKISLQEASTKGVLLYFDNLQGTHVFEVSMLETQTGREGCLAETAMILEIFTAEPQIVTGRSSITRQVSPSSIGRVTREGGPQVTRVVFLGDLEVLDGYKLSTLHLMKHLPTNFRASTLDLSCACEWPTEGDFPRKYPFHCPSLEG